MDDALKQRLYLIADEMRGIASIQNYFAKVIYETERAQRIMEMAAEITALAEQKPVDDLKAVFEIEPWNRFSPAIGVEAVVLNEKQEILLIQRRDNAHWALPGGLAEIGHTFPESTLRELWEEAGLRGEVKRMLGVFDGRRWGTRTNIHLVHLVFLVECSDLSPSPGIECLDAAFFARDSLPEPMHGGHGLRIPVCFEALNGDTYFDPADSLHIEMPMFQRPDDASAE